MLINASLNLPFFLKSFCILKFEQIAVGEPAYNYEMKITIIT